MSRWTDEAYVPLGVLVGAFLLLAGIGTLVTQPWQYHGSTSVTILRIVGTIGTIAIGAGLLYLAVGIDWLEARRA